MIFKLGGTLVLDLKVDKALSQLENIDAIEERLWGAADTMRANSNYASNEYFMPAMGLIFLRHVYSRFLAVKDDIVASLPTRGGRTRELTKEDYSQKKFYFPARNCAI
jgi:type I restriction enzyme M protein